MPQLGADPAGRRAPDADFGAPQQIVGLWPQAPVLAWVADAVARWRAMPITRIALPAEPAPGAALLAAWLDAGLTGACEHRLPVIMA